MRYTRRQSSARAYSNSLCVSNIIIVVVSMAGDMWPQGVRTPTDMTRFARLIVGPAASLENFGKLKLPEDREDTFLFVSRGGCERGTPLAELASCVPDMMEDLRELTGTTMTGRRWRLRPALLPMIAGMTPLN